MRPLLLAAALAATLLVPAAAHASAIDTDAPGRETRASATEYIILLLGGTPPEREDKEADEEAGTGTNGEGWHDSDRSNVAQAVTDGTPTAA